MATRVHSHSPLPAPVMHAGAVSIQQSKSHVLAGVQDAYWSDDEAEDADCPLCMEEMDISDINFKPCPCGYQICRFCWHHIKENLNGRCPACRREYTDDAVQFKPINKEDHKRLTQQKKQRERERKELDALNRRHLANVRVVQRNVAYVVGLGPRFAKEELIPTLRSNEYFGQYGKISKIVIVKRTPPGGRAPVVGLYITYHRREDAARCIAAVDGAPSPGGSHDIMRASHGTTKYCMAFLRGVSCTDHSCMNLHEWGDEKDCFTKEDLTTLKHTMKDTESRARTTTVTRKAEESDAGLPRAASWANKGLHSTPVHTTLGSLHSLPSSSRTRRAAPSTRPQRSGSTTNDPKPVRDRKIPLPSTLSPKPPSIPSSSRPTTPGSLNRPVTPGTTKVKTKESATTSTSRSPPPESDLGSASQGVTPPLSPEVVVVTTKGPSHPTAPAVPPGIPAVPPGLTPPPGLPHPARLSPSGSAQVSVQPSQSSYQMSTQAQALVEDIRARRESTSIVINQSPFPDFDRMLQALTGGDDNGFSFTLDPKLAVNEHDAALTLPELEAETANTPYSGTFMDIFPGVRPSAQSSPSLSFMPPPGLTIPQGRPGFDPANTRSPISDRGSTSSGYTGSFNPFASENSEDPPSRRYSPLDEERKVSRFGFARGRQGSSSSPLHAPSPLSHSESLSHTSFYASSEVSSPAINQAQPQWSYPNRNHAFDFSPQPPSAMSSPLATHAQAQSPYIIHQQPPPTRFQPFDAVSEAQLRELISSSSRDRINTSRNGPTDPQAFKYNPSQPFSDPAIMSASPLVPPQQSVHNGNFTNAPAPAGTFVSPGPASFGPPPGLAYPPGIIPAPMLSGRQASNGPPAGLEISHPAGSAHVSATTSPVPSPALSQSDFPALHAPEPPTRQASDEPSASPKLDATVDDKEKAKAERKAAKKAAAAERAAERQRLIQEKLAAKAVEREKKAAEKEKAAAALKAEKEEAARKKAEEERIAKEKAEKERAEREKVKAEKERLEKEKKGQQAKKDKEKEQEQAKVVAGTKGLRAGKAIKRADSESSTTTTTSGQKGGKGRAQPKQNAVLPTPEPVTQAPILARMPKKNKPIARPIKVPKDDPSEAQSSIISAATSETPGLLDRATDTTSNNSRAQSVERVIPSDPTSLEELFCDIDTAVPWMHIPKHPFFDMTKINPAAKMPLEYGPLVHALSALSVGGGTFANNMPSGSIDNAVSSFQQLLETLTQTISDLLRLLPRTTWDDSSSFDGVLRDMLKGDDFLDADGEDHGNHGKEDEVAALTQALERRARWMEVQLSKLEELHRDINTAAVRAVLSFNDNGWDRQGSRNPTPGNSLQRFDQIGWIDEKEGEKGRSGQVKESKEELEVGKLRSMTTRELEEKLEVAKDAARTAEADLREAMRKMQELRPLDDDEW